MPEPTPTPTDPAGFPADDHFVRSLARRLLRDPQAADDAAQDTWLAAVAQGQGTGWLDGLSRGWLAAVVRNFALQALRGRQRRLLREQAVARGLCLDPDAATLDPDQAERLRRAVDQLPADYRTVVQLRFFDDLLPTRIAEQLDVPVETVRTRLKRALQRLQALLRATGSGR
ncbi:MAG: sigma-70 family RNA polymerase sigma factor [Planctomycetes bacterium]|nr:sigma-70 family RNA polymerase sigma factor [Planctomycetota bacterium]